MVIISDWAGVTYASECFLPGLPALQRKSLWKRGNHQALFESYAPIINCLERKNYGATWCYDSFHSSFFLSIAFRMVSNLRIQSTSATFLVFPAGVVRPADMCGITGMLCELNCVLLAGDVYWWFGSVLRPDGVMLPSLFYIKIQKQKPALWAGSLEQWCRTRNRKFLLSYWY